MGWYSILKDNKTNMETKTTICDWCESHEDEDASEGWICVIEEGIDEDFSYNFCNWHCLRKYAIEKEQN